MSAADDPLLEGLNPVQREAVTHVDGTARLQTVFQDTSPRYHRLIETLQSCLMAEQLPQLALIS